MKKKNKKINRREMLSLFGAFAGASMMDSPIAWYTRSVLDGFVQQAYAQATGVVAKRYLNIQQPGAPSRWTWDLFLTPYSTANFQANGQVGTRYTANAAGNYASTTYATVLRNGINVPWVWQFEIPRAGGGTRPMTDLLQNLLAIQGITTSNPGHPGSQAFHFRPTGATQTLGALSADGSEDAPIAAINAGAQNFSFLSRAGKSVTPIPTNGNWLTNLMDPFTNTIASTNFATNQARVQAAIDRAVVSLDAMAKTDNVIGDSLSKNRAGAVDLLRGGLGNLTTTWNNSLTKYRDLITRAMNPGNILTGLNDRPIPGGTTAQHMINNTTGATGADLRTGITNNTSVSMMAEAFSLAEFVLLNNLSRSITTRINGITGLSNAVFGAGALNHDEHNSGTLIVTYLNSLYARAYSACLLELIDRLRAAGIWNDTVIDVSGEFNRSARNDGSGADHGFTGKSVALYSGAIRGPLIVGNLAAGGGGWGRGGQVTVSGATIPQLTMAHMASSVAHVLGVPSPVTSAPSVVNVSATATTSLIGTTRTV